MMYGSAERSLAQWFAAPQRKPLVIRGARQVGKSTLRHQVSGTRQSVEMTLLSLPLYLVGQLGRLLDRLRRER